jgi:hypothetical protein
VEKGGGSQLLESMYDDLIWELRSRSLSVPFRSMAWMTSQRRRARQMTAALTGKDMTGISVRKATAGLECVQHIVGSVVWSRTLRGRLKHLRIYQRLVSPLKR